MEIKIGSLIKVKSESQRESDFTGTVMTIYRANDAPDGSTDARDYVLEVKKYKTGEILNVSGPRVIKVY